MQFNQIKFQSFKSRTYLGSPSIIRLLDGDLLVTHDYFGQGCPRNHESEEHLTSVYRSDDGQILPTFPMPIGVHFLFIIIQCT